MNIRQDFLEPNYFYHIYNRGINGCVIFNDDENRKYFLRKIKEYLIDSVEVYAYCLMPNHFHLVIKIKENITTDVSKQIGKLISN